MMRTRIAVLAAVLACWIGPAVAAGDPDAWSAYLDYAYVYSSAQPTALEARLEGYARETGVSLDDYIAERFPHVDASAASLSEADKRRQAIAYLLDYLASGRGESLAAAARAVDRLENRLERHENRYWYHYIHAHEALAYGSPEEFVREVMRLWFRVVVELETPYRTYQTLSLDQSTHVGFASALPYLYENVARLILIRSPQMGLDHDLDALAAVVRFLGQGRVGAYPDAIPSEASSREYLERILARLDGPESDGASLSFTLALFEASKHHDRARSLLASDGFSKPTLDAVRVSIGAYEDALRLARTLQGQTAVYTRVLRQLGELHAAKQRLGVEPEIDVPFSIERATKIYAALYQDRERGWERHGYRDHGRDAYVTAMRALWEEIQEASFNTAEYYLARGIQERELGNESLSAAARFYAGYLSLFDAYGAESSEEEVPDSAYFAAYWAAKGIGDAILSFDGGSPSTAQIQEAIDRYREAVDLFPFDPKVWAAIATSLERQGRDDEYLTLTKPAAERVARSRALDTWIAQGRELGSVFDGLRRALADDLVVMYLGFADSTTLAELEAGLEGLRDRREQVKAQLSELQARLKELRDKRAATLAPEDAPPANLPPVSAPGPAPRSGREIVRLSSRIDELVAAQGRLDEQIEARSRALPLFKQVLENGQFVPQLAAQREHPVHALVRRMYFESVD